MLTLLLKTSLIWGLLLLLYFGSLSKEKSYAQARIYLWLTLLSGICLPIGTTNITVNTMDAGTAAATDTLTSTAEKSALKAQHIVWIIWLTGAFIKPAPDKN